MTADAARPTYRIVDGRILDPAPLAPLSETPVAGIADLLQDLYERGEFVSERTWELIAELIRRIPDAQSATPTPVTWHDLTDDLVTWIRHDPALAGALAAATRASSTAVSGDSELDAVD